MAFNTERKFRMICVSCGLLGLTLVLLAPSCRSIRNLTETSAPLVLYNPGKTALHPEFRVFHNAADESTLYFRVMTRELLFSQANPEIKELARVSVAYTLYTSHQDKKWSVRDTAEFVIEKALAKSAYIGAVSFPTETNKTYLLAVEFTDQTRQTSVRDMILVDRFSEFPQQDFLTVDDPENRDGFQTFYYPEESFRLIHRDLPAGPIYVSRFASRNILPLPPWSQDEPTDLAPVPDSTWIINYSPQSYLQLNGRGIYVFHRTIERAQGFCVVQFNDHFPQVTQPEDMLPPLQYITTREEYRKMIETENRKQALDDFWIAKGITFPNARDLIRVYYNRVLFANHYFTSTREGWKTDRGMIYTIIGPPEQVVKTEAKESWIYRDSQTNRTIQFDFVLRTDFWTGYEYRMVRSEDYRSLWIRAVETWRHGKIFVI